MTNDDLRRRADGHVYDPTGTNPAPFDEDGPIVPITAAEGLKIALTLVLIAVAAFALAIYFLVP